MCGISDAPWPGSDSCCSAVMGTVSYPLAPWFVCDLMLKAANGNGRIFTVPVVKSRVRFLP